MRGRSFVGGVVDLLDSEERGDVISLVCQELSFLCNDSGSLSNVWAVVICILY